MLVRNSGLDRETAQYVIDKEGRIVAATPAEGARFLSVAAEGLHGQRLRALLVQLEPTWEACLPATLSDEGPPIYLPWGEHHPRRPGGLRLHRLPCGPQTAITLTTALPRAEMLSEGPTPRDEPLTDAQLERLVLRLQASEDQFTRYRAQFPGIFFAQRADLSLALANPGFAELVGVDSEILQEDGNAFLACIVPQDRAPFLKAITDIQSPPAPVQTVIRVRHADTGALVYLLDVRTARLGDKGELEGYEGVWLDVTRREVAEQRLTRAAWKQDLAVLSNSLIHDFSNVMAGIYNLSEVYHAELPDGHAWRRGISQIMKNAKEARRLMRRIIDLHRAETGKRGYFDLETLLHDYIELVRAILPKGVKLETAFTGKELPLYIDDVAFRQVLLNLAMNARDAVGLQGTVTVATRPVAAGETLGAEMTGGPWQAPREGAEIRFSDSGGGIPASHLSRIFEAFFTTKELGKGSGFGLYNARRFMEEAGGHLDVTSAEGEGTTFLLYLPLTDFTEEDEPAPTPAGGGDERYYHNRPSILVYAHRHASELGIVADLRERNWEVITFGNAPAALHFLRSTPLRPRLLYVNLGAPDPAAATLIEAVYADRLVPRIAARVFDEGNAALSPAVRAHVDAFLEPEARPEEDVASLEALLQS